MRDTIHLLFICSMNQWRSPTAEQVYRDYAGVNVRSRGTSQSARRTVTADDLKWADLIFVMENKQKSRLESDYPGDLRYKELYMLDIPDIYKYMDPDLIDEITASVDPILESYRNRLDTRPE